MQEIKKGDYVSRISYMKIEENLGRYQKVSNETGFTWDISNDVLKEECISASEFSEEIKVSRTELIEKFNNVGATVFTVNFDKSPSPEDYLAATRGKGNIILSFDDMKKQFKKIKGENRTLVGYMIKVENGFGRSNVIDLEIPHDQHRIRQVDHRSLNWLIVNGIKYIVKK